MIAHAAPPRAPRETLPSVSVCLMIAHAAPPRAPRETLPPPPRLEGRCPVLTRGSSISGLRVEPGGGRRPVLGRPCLRCDGIRVRLRWAGLGPSKSGLRGWKGGRGRGRGAGGGHGGGGSAARGAHTPRALTASG